MHKCLVDQYADDVTFDQNPTLMSMNFISIMG